VTKRAARPSERTASIISSAKSRQVPLARLGAVDRPLLVAKALLDRARTSSSCGLVVSPGSRKLRAQAPTGPSGSG
jgi:hypothetical protein